MSEALDRATRLVLALLPNGVVDGQAVAAACDDVLAMLASRDGGSPDRDVLLRRVESLVIIEQEAPDWLADPGEHIEWLTDRKDQIEWNFWDRYRRYLEEVEFLPPKIISRLDDSTDRVLSRLDDPERSGRWDRRGLVVGQVQSGKTGHYIGLACKAADAGYKLIVVLAGMHDSLRSQTQLRLDQGLLGFDTQFQFRTDEKTRFMGVGAMKGVQHPPMASLTTSKDDGDFQAVRARNLNLPIGQIPILLVVKKNSYILKNLYQWLSQMQGVTRPGSNHVSVPDVPLLVIDDEADNASVNTKKDDEDPAKINQLIRQLLKLFEKSSYVGYTATPFANIFASAAEEDGAWGPDLFPQHFVESLKPPTNYFGPVQVFGLDTGDEAVEPAPVFRAVRDCSDWMPDKHQMYWTPDPDDFPESLRRAVLSFVLSCAARRARGEGTAHNSMLIHTTRFVLVQGHVKDQVEDLLLTTRYRIRYGEGDSSGILEELRQIWEEDYLPTSDYWAGEFAPLTWDEVGAHLQPATEKITVKALNGSSKDALQYYENRSKGLSVIAIGGDKLSRGLTLEGLSVSYYLRASKMYDTLLQMGRWFGYRPGYQDLCRLYTTPSLYSWYREITLAAEELRSDFEDMASRDATPSEYGLRVRQSPAGLLVTSPSKMRKAKRIRWSYSGDVSESVTFLTGPKDLAANLDALNDLLATAELNGSQQMGEPAENAVWRGVDGGIIADFFARYRADSEAKKARPELIERYIRDALAVHELTQWTVVLIRNSRPPNTTDKIHGQVLGLTKREPLVQEEGRYTIGRLVSPADEMIDLTQEDIRDLMESAGGKAPRGPAIRRRRRAEEGLLLVYPIDSQLVDGAQGVPMIGFAASFPFSGQDISRDYQANEIFQKIALNQLNEDDSDD